MAGFGVTTDGSVPTFLLRASQSDHLMKTQGHAKDYACGLGDKFPRQEGPATSGYQRVFGPSIPFP
jgi:hypothetical protein